ncbi:hypothetical protein T439DRAFT_360889 [Meredithblackwellia eburnea MCA 4105]
MTHPDESGGPGNDQLTRHNFHPRQYWPTGRGGSPPLSPYHPQSQESHSTRQQLYHSLQKTLLDLTPEVQILENQLSQSVPGLVSFQSLDESWIRNLTDLEAVLREKLGIVEDLKEVVRGGQQDELALHSVSQRDLRTSMISPRNLGGSRSDSSAAGHSSGYPNDSWE